MLSFSHTLVFVFSDGGAVEFGATNIYNGAPLVAHSIRQGAPIIYVAMNYRLHVSAPSSCLYHFHCHLNPYSCLFHRTGFWIPRWKTGLR